MTQPFEQQPRESAKAFAAFTVYLGMGAERSLAAVGKKLGKSEGLIERWSAKFDWASRVQAHAAHLALVEREAIEVAARGKAAEWEIREQKLKETEWELHGELVEAGRKTLEKFKDGSRDATLGDVARALEIASKLGRLATGLGTEGERRDGDDLPALRVEVTVALEKIYGDGGECRVASVEGKEPVVDVEEIGKVESGKQKIEIQTPALCRDAATEKTA